MSACFETVAALKYFIEKYGLVQCPCDSAERRPREITLRQKLWMASHPKPLALGGGDGGIRTLDTLNTYDDLANRCLQPLGHVSDAGAFAVI